MKNFWLDRRPKIIQVTDMHNPDIYMKWYVTKPNNDTPAFIGFGSSSYFLHWDGVWRTTTYNYFTEQYSGYYDTWEEAYERLMRK